MLPTPLLKLDANRFHSDRNPPSTTALRPELRFALWSRRGVAWVVMFSTAWAAIGRAEVPSPPPVTTVGTGAKLQRLENDTTIEVTTAGASHSKSIIASYRFERPEDKNFDGYPDGWTRRRDIQHPPYVPIKIVAHNPDALETTRAFDRFMLRPWEQARTKIGSLPPLPPSAADLLVDRYLRIQLDGGAAMLQSPLIPFDSSFRYQLSGRLFTDGLRHNHAYAELVFLNAAGELIRSVRSETFSGTQPWTNWKTEMAASPPGATTLAIRLHLSPQQWGQDRDIYGVAGFDDLAVMQVPQVRVDTDRRLAVYRAGEQPSIKMVVLGLKDPSNLARFVVVDSEGREIDRKEQAFLIEKVSISSDGTTEREEQSAVKAGSRPALEDAVRPVPEKDNGTLTSKQQQQSDKAWLNPKDEGSVIAKLQETPVAVEIEATAQWRLPSLPPGFYFIRSGLIENGREWLRTETTLAVLSDLSIQSSSGPFGWTLPEGVGNVELKTVPDWLKESGVFQLKYPLWIEPDNRVALDNAAWLTERLKEEEIRCIGLLANPPPSIQAIIDEREARQPVAANLFRDARVWQPLLEPIMTRLSIRVATWQLGVDGDHSFIGRPKLPEVIREINSELQGYGQPIGVAISWPWLDILPPEVAAVASAVSRSADVPLTAGELGASLRFTTAALPASTTPEVANDASKSRSRQENWLDISPLDSTQYHRDVRINDLLLRMGTVRGHEVSGAFISNPRDRRRGVLRRDWRPDELYLPWRTASALLGDVKNVGTIELEDAGSNMVFANDNRMMVMMWSGEPSSVDIFLGDRVRQIDAWGRPSTPGVVMNRGEVRSHVQLDQTPIFLIDVDPVVVSTRMTARLVEDRIDSLLGRRQSVGLTVWNPTKKPLSGTATLVPPNDWLVESPPQAFDLAPGETRDLLYDIVLRNSARIGDVPLLFQFVMRNEPPLRFSIERKITVGPNGLEIELTTKQVGQSLVVQLQLRNRSGKEQQYDCLLFPPDGRQYQRRQIGVAVGETVRRDFVWEDGESLIGKTMLLRAVEQGGGRILNQSINVTR